MFTMIDHLAAALVGTVALVIVLALSVRSRESAVETTVNNVAQTRAQEFMRVLERDVENMRPEAETNAAVGAYTCATVRNAGGRLESFTLPTLLDPDLGPASPIGHVTYLSLPVGDSVMVDGRPRPLHRVLRFEDDGSGALPAGGSGDVVVELDVQLFARQGTAPATSCPDDLGRVRLEVATAIAGPELHRDGSTTRGGYNISRQGYTIRPPARGR